jgi:hypothetical protein
LSWSVDGAGRIFWSTGPRFRRVLIAKNQNTFAKRQREQEKKRKTEDKVRRRDERKANKEPETGVPGPASAGGRRLTGNAERLNFDEFDLLCRAADTKQPATCESLAEGLTGVNNIARANVALPNLLRHGFLEETSAGLYRITPDGTTALS